MADELPDGLAIESIWVVEAAYGPDAAERRAPVRAEHLRRIDALRQAGTIVEAGAYTDMSGSLILVRAADEAAARAIVEADVYTRTGVWTGFRIRRLGRVVRSDGIEAV
jgi:uncharacterized protein YciI